MRAYNLAMLMLLINAGMALTVSMGIFGPQINKLGTQYAPLVDALSNPVLVLGLVGAIGGIAIVTSLPFTGSGGEKAPNAAAIAAFSGTYFISMMVTIGMFQTLGSTFPGFQWFVNLYMMINVLIFLFAIIQMITGGAKSSV